MAAAPKTTMRLRPLLRPVTVSRPARAFISIKSPAPPAPIEPSDAQSMPLGAYYESILNTPQPIPPEKSEEPPQSSIPKREEAAEKEDGAPSPPPPPAKKPIPTKTKPGRKKKNTDAEAISIPTTTATATTRAAADAASSSSSSQPVSEETLAKARIVFGSRLAGPAERAERLASLRSRSTLVAGVLVPPQPDEPDNCCMSGCVNCVWDRYREEMETWSAVKAEAQKRLRAQHGERAATAVGAAAATASSRSGADGGSVSMDDDSGGSETAWDVGPARIAKDLWDDTLYRDVPVGIREFMRLEKSLKERHMRRAQVVARILSVYG